MPFRNMQFAPSSLYVPLVGFPKSFIFELTVYCAVQVSQVLLWSTSLAVWYLIGKFLSKNYLLEVKLKENLEQFKIISLNLCQLMYAGIRISSFFILLLVLC